MSNFFEFGVVFHETHPISKPVKQIYNACAEHPDFEIVEIRSVNRDGDTIVVDCCNPSVPSRNSVGIKNRERLALEYSPNSDIPYKVRTLRKDFPNTLHRYYVKSGEPKSLCLYIENWCALERYWTPQFHLQRILYWLQGTACGTLHLENQPLEQLYYASPYKVILPIDFNEKIKEAKYVFVFSKPLKPNKKTIIYRSKFVLPSDAPNYSSVGFSCLLLNLSPVIHAAINYFPPTLGELQNQFQSRGSDFISELQVTIKKFVSSDGIDTSIEDNYTLLILNIPMKRSIDEQPTETKTIGFAVDSSISKLGEACGVLFNGQDGKFYKECINTRENDKWQSFQIEPIEIVEAITREKAQIFSGINQNKSEFNAALVGVGTLGSTLADIWSKEAWGSWTFIDDDYIRPHNITRHISREWAIGFPKAEVVKNITDNNFEEGYIKNKFIIEQGNKFENEDILSTIKDSELIVDVSTTLEFPRDISDLDSAPRSASLFITPSGNSAVMLLEDIKREIRLDSLESQYYRSLINEPWGKNHLVGHSGYLWVGAGCRDISVILSQELISLHAGTLARRLRQSLDKKNAKVSIWDLDDRSGALVHHDIPLYSVKEMVVGAWIVKWDNYIHNKMHDLREKHLPNETGGIIVGYIDQKQKKIVIVDIFEAPSDSDASADGFTRGTSNLKDTLDKIALHTANIVEYIGEWHSHPPKASVLPSIPDYSLILYLTTQMAKEGKPALMVIAGDQDLNICIGDS